MKTLGVTKQEIEEHNQQKSAIDEAISRVPDKEKHASEVMRVYKETIDRITEDRMQKVKLSKENLPQYFNNLPDTAKFEV